MRGKANISESLEKRVQNTAMKEVLQIASRSRGFKTHENQTKNWSLQIIMRNESKIKVLKEAFEENSKHRTSENTSNWTEINCSWKTCKMTPDSRISIYALKQHEIRLFQKSC